MSFDVVAMLCRSTTIEITQNQRSCSVISKLQVIFLLIRSSVRRQRVEVDFHFICENVRVNDIWTPYVCSVLLLIDILIKSLTLKFIKLLIKLTNIDTFAPT